MRYTEGIEKTDARTYSPDAQHQIRGQSIQLRGKGFSNRLVAEGAGIIESHASRIWQSYKKEGTRVIKLGRRGRCEGEDRTLGKEQEVKLKRDVLDKTQSRFNLSLPCGHGML